MKKILLSLVALTLVSGCATLFQGGASEKLIIEYATMKVVEKGSTSADRQARAAKIQEIASEAHKFLDQSSVTLAVLEAAVRARIAALNLQPSDQFLAEALIASVVTDLQGKIGDGVLNPDQLVRVNTVLSWVEEAAGFYL